MCKWHAPKLVRTQDKVPSAPLPPGAGTAPQCWRPLLSSQCCAAGGLAASGARRSSRPGQRLPGQVRTCLFSRASARLSSQTFTSLTCAPAPPPKVLPTPFLSQWAAEKLAAALWGPRAGHACPRKAAPSASIRLSRRALKDCSSQVFPTERQRRYSRMCKRMCLKDTVWSQR